MGDLTLILGGARSGKSTYGQRLAVERAGQTIYLATARSLDEEMEMRIAIHRQDRPAGWDTVEIATGVGRMSLPPGETVLLDCLTMLVTNVVMDAAGQDVDHPDEGAAVAAVEAEIDELIVAIQRSPASWIVISNEVGLGLVPPYPLGRLYRDLLGRANQRLAGMAQAVIWMVAGIPVPIHPYRIQPG